MPELTPIQSQVIAGLLAGKSVSAVARENNIHRSAIYHWRLEHSCFKIVLDKARSRQQTAMFDLVQDLAEEAIEVVSHLLVSEDAKLRLRAAQAILRLANPGHLSKETRWVDFEALDAYASPQPEFNTIRQNPTHSSEPRCCGEQPDRSHSIGATAVRV
jgi:transposase-like protein